jgi:hypothetical protein
MPESIVVSITKQIGGRRTAVYSAPVWPTTALSLANTTMRVEWLEGAQALVERQLEDLRWAREKLKVDRSEPDPNWLGERQPMKHQRQAVSAIPYMRDRVLLADDMGLGKTSTSLWAVKYAQGITRILVICPASVKFNWEREIITTLGWPSFIIDGTPKQKASIFADILACDSPATPHLCVVINYDLLAGLPDNQLQILKTFVADQALICDESHYLKSRKWCASSALAHQSGTWWTTCGPRSRSFGQARGPASGTSASGMSCSAP